MTHTPGPWKASQTHPAGDWCIHAAGIPWQLAYLAASDKIEWPLEANARLIAAAPDQNAALIKVIEWYSVNGGGAPTYTDHFPIEEVRAAIAKATGGASAG